jgi:hypothetical protein
MLDLRMITVNRLSLQYEKHKPSWHFKSIQICSRICRMFQKPWPNNVKCFNTKLENWAVDNHKQYVLLSNSLHTYKHKYICRCRLWALTWSRTWLRQPGGQENDVQCFSWVHLPWELHSDWTGETDMSGWRPVERRPAWVSL